MHKEPQWIAVKTPDEMKRLVETLANSEANYRKMHDHHGADNMETGRAWDQMRRAGDAARAVLHPTPSAVPPAAEPRPGEPAPMTESPAGNHTPGPWSAWRTPDDRWAIRSVRKDDEGRRITSFPAVCDGQDKEANAKLIASAPAMLEALKNITEFCDDPDGSEKPESLAQGIARMLPAARAAIKSAQGE